MNPLSQICSVTEAARIIGVSEERVHVFREQGRIKAKQLKREYAFDLASVKAFAKRPRPPGPIR